MPDRSVPTPGLGTWGYESSTACARSVRTALELGYRHVDTAQKYDNERAVGRAIAQSSLSRSDVFVATKVAETELAYDDVFASVEASLDRLEIDRVDMLYVHWPAPTYDAEATLSAFNECLERGHARHVGLANFTPALLKEALGILDEPPLAVQVEMHPLCQQPELQRYVSDRDMSLVAYCPLMRGDVFDVPELQSVARDAGVSPAALSLAWLCSKGVVPIPKAASETHLRENLAAADLDLDDEILARVDAIDRTRRVVDPPEKAPWNW